MHALYIMLVVLSVMLIASVATYLPVFVRLRSRRRAERLFARRSCSDAIEQYRWHRHEPIIIHVPQYMVQPKLGWPGYTCSFYNKRNV